uniref:Uncharacterized protein n=1 Tax=viral metagenome TaxID=1070528 RepID=A0A6C0KYE9_9ZZZZ
MNNTPSSNNSVGTSTNKSSITSSIGDFFGSSSSKTDTTSNISTSSSSNSIGGFFSNISWTSWIVIILILAFLGLNIFVYLAKGTQVFAELSAYLASIIGTGAAETTKQVTNVTATGTKAATDIAAGTVNTTVDVAQDTASQIKNANYTEQQQLNSSLNNAKTEQKTIEQEKESGYSADEATSSIQSSKSTSKAGWCYIGEDRGFRSCIQVGVNDQCMSGDIFPSQEICMNPTLRP